MPEGLSVGRGLCALALSALMLAGWWSPPSPAAGPPPRPLSREQVERLVADLGAANPDVRAAAARRLGELAHVPSALREAAAPAGKADRALRARAGRAL